MLKNKIIYKLNPKQQQSIDSFLSTLNESSYDPVISCEICDGQEFTEISDIDRHGIKKSTKLCKGCGYLFINPKLNNHTHKQYYEKFYRKNDREFSVPTKEFYELEKFRGLDILNFIKSHSEVRKEFKCLDVGCGSAATTYALSTYFANAVGIDLDINYASNVEKKDNLKIMQTTIHDQTFDHSKFQIIVYCHVFEHINKPIEELKRIKEILSDDGLLYIEVPGINYNDYWYDGNFFNSLEMDHTHQFNKRSLQNLMEQNGFELIYGNEIIKSIWKKNITYKKFTIKNEYSNILKKIQLYDNKYRIAFIFFKNYIKNKIIKILKYLLKKIGIFSFTKKFFCKLIKKN